MAENLVPVFVHSVDLEGLFGEVQTNRANPFHFLLPEMMWEDYNSLASIRERIAVKGLSSLVRRSRLDIGLDRLITDGKSFQNSSAQ